MNTPLNILMVTLDGGGNVPPMFGLARQLAERGHPIRVLTEPCLAAPVAANGFQFQPFRDHFTRTNRREDILKDWNSSPLANPVFKNIMLGPAQTLVQQTADAIRQEATDLVLIDILLFPALIAAQVAHIPGVLVSHMPELLPGANRPPGGMGLLPGKGWLGHFRDRVLGQVFHKVMNQYLPVLNAVRTEHSLPELKNVADLMHEADLRLIQTLPTFDFPLNPAPANVRYTGPLLQSPDWNQTWQNPWSEADQRPLVVVSFSTTFQNQRSAVQNTLDALSNLPVRGLLTPGPALEHETFSVPDNVVVVHAAPHDQIFPLADLVISHGGHGTLMRALANGIPLICMPMGRDQNDNAAKVAHWGCGLHLSPKAKPSRIRQAIQEVLADNRFKQQAARFQSDIQATTNQTAILTELENLVAARHNNLNEIV